MAALAFCAGGNLRGVMKGESFPACARSANGAVVSNTRAKEGRAVSSQPGGGWTDGGRCTADGWTLPPLMNSHRSPARERAVMDGAGVEEVCRLIEGGREGKEAACPCGCCSGLRSSDSAVAPVAPPESEDLHTDEPFPGTVCMPGRLPPPSQRTCG